ncbi:hypothetical protein HOP50_13g69250 [Chloropicon primus]|uniref:Uncharacterized protein n=1 Tax=Chloropicon primus TaxID=1764295 RepID=A0A5B8MUD5_9CHLO|nr:hypothetical protein A3770_13p69060 [Chloropicon primus]UPR03595.1 hypothetical protein HOP50_13g69250 [Chloropicon primus]|mmetsp:Transcript_5141/g.15453  ORF Transcript_5141/g.15453 Transcript_5141/m.15453 type:complete len:272 (-) Transcript_5141:41-856(-)|eukprot:QDZ24388.1 hypothetical protein A3770_13p69060 [Chloropicon primus]
MACARWVRQGAALARRGSATPGVVGCVFIGGLDATTPVRHLAVGGGANVNALADQYLDEMRSLKQITGPRKITELLELCESRQDFEKAVEVLRLSRGLMNNRKQFTPYSTNVTKALLASSDKAEAQDVLFDLVRERNLLGLPFSKTRLLRVLKTVLTDAEPMLFNDDSKMWEVYHTAVTQVKEESGEVSANIVKHILRHLVRHGKSELALEMASDLGRISPAALDAKAIVDRFSRDFEEPGDGGEAAAAEDAEEEEEGSSGEGEEGGESAK